MVAQQLQVSLLIIVDRDKNHSIVREQVFSVLQTGHHEGKPC